ncbi:ATP-binding cassette domain-containing protein [Yunchengibacter salinarum]|uniref:ATP-binding cassette domain-containing protein n=1 Tax=Yunchengibacter salinarum TaxID=3133399 RepID=UPI0035B69B2C
MMEARSVSLLHRGRALVDDCSLRLAPGQVTAILGPNGAGKSSLMGLLTGARTPDRGAVMLGGRPLAYWPGPALARRRAVLDQMPPPAPGMRAVDMVMMGRDPYMGLESASDSQGIVEWALHQAHVTDLAGRIMTTLSGGEQQRVHLARALAQIGPLGTARPGDGAPRVPPVLFLDEPTNNLDLTHQQSVLGVAEDLARAGAAVCVVLHDPNLALAFAHRAVVLNQGGMVADGPPHGVLTPRLMKSVFKLDMTLAKVPDGPSVLVPVPRTAPAEPAV